MAKVKHEIYTTKNIDDIIAVTINFGQKFISPIFIYVVCRANNKLQTREREREKIFCLNDFSTFLSSYLYTSNLRDFYKETLCILYNVFDRKPLQNNIVIYDFILLNSVNSNNFESY